MEKSPDAFRTISEVAEHLETPAHVLRFWESRFPQIRPVKRAGGRRYYRPADVALLTGIKRLLHDEGMTIRGVQKILREQGVRYVSGMADETTADDDDAALEAALASSSGASGDLPTLPAAEAEAAQVIALETALSESAKRADNIEDSMPPNHDATDFEVTSFSADMAEADSEEVPAGVLPTPFSPKAKEPVRTPPSPRKPASDDGISDLFSRMVASTSSSEADNVGSEDVESDVEIIDFSATKSPPKLVTMVDQQPSDETPTGLGTERLEGDKVLDKPEDEEAPMAVWAEDEVTEEKAHEQAVSLKEPGPTLRITRIGAASSMPSPMDAESKLRSDTAQIPDSDLAPTISSRLRATRADQLSHSDRRTMTIIRARARSLRDRLVAPPRLGH